MAKKIEISLASATVQMPYLELKKLTDGVRELERQNADLVKELQTRKTEVLDPVLIQAFDAAVPLVQFAVSQHDPLTVQAWPHEKLTELSEAMGAFCDPSTPSGELVFVWRNFATRCRDIEKGRNIEEARQASEEETRKKVQGVSISEVDSSPA